MSVNLNKENFFDKDNNSDSKIVEFPNKDSRDFDARHNLKETQLVIKNGNKEKRLYTVDEDRTNLDSQRKNKADIILLDTAKQTANSKFSPKTIMFILGAIIIGAILLWSLLHKNAQEVYVGENSIGIIKGTSTTVEQITEDALEKLIADTGTNIEVNEEISLVPVRAKSKDIISIDDALSKISKKFTFKVEAYVITVNGAGIATVKSEEDAISILTQISSMYKTEGVMEVQEPTFVESVKIENKYVSEKDIVDIEQGLLLLTANTDQGMTYEVKEGDTLYEIALNADMTLQELLQANPDVSETAPLKIGKELTLIVPTPLLSVRTYEQVVYNETIPKTVETINNDDEYKTYRKVISEGQDGTKEVTATVTKVNGIEENREVISETVIVQPTVEKVEVGTLNTPPKKAIGSFIYPTNGTLSSGYGYRWGTMHQGIDLASPYGTAIKASDGGTVIFSGWDSGGYGNMVKIDHGNGFVTVYAHNSRNAVSVGQKVAQGEVIAYVGSTGDSTGNHVHFELLKNGSHVNPINYLK